MQLSVGLLVLTRVLVRLPSTIIAPQASFEESATTEASRRCPLTGFLRDFGVLFSGHTFEASATGIGHLVVQNTTPEMLRIGTIRFVCLYVCQRTCTSVFRKIVAQKRELASISVGEAEYF